MAIDHEGRQKQNALLKSHGYRWVKANNQRILKDAQGQTTTIEKALEAIHQKDINQKNVDQKNIIQTVLDLSNRPAVQRWAQTIIRHRPLILDTETTGSGADAEIIDIALVDIHGHVVFNSLVRPTQLLSQESSRVHGITEKMLESAPSFAELWRPLRPLLTGYEIIIYNAAFDLRLLRQTAARHQQILPAVISHCLMKQYALYAGEKISEREYKMHQLSAASETFHIQSETHRALSDAQAARELLLALATTTSEQ
jgi:DNA polymerase III epsilon subunit-like protein